VIFIFIYFYLQVASYTKGLWTGRCVRLYAGKDISRVKVSQEVGNGRQVIREGEKVGVGHRVFEAKWSELGQENEWETVTEKSE